MVCGCGFRELTEVVDKDSPDHGPTAAAEAQVQALQDPLGGGTQGRRHGTTQVGDTGRPHGGMRHTCGGTVSREINTHAHRNTHTHTHTQVYVCLSRGTERGVVGVLLSNTLISPFPHHVCTIQ